MARRHLYRRIVLSMAVITFTMTTYAQDEGYDDLLQRVDTIENPVYKPVVALSYGVLNFVGDVKNAYLVPVIGNPAARISISTFIDNKKFVTANFFFMTGLLSGNQYSLTDPEQNLNFTSSIYSIGASARYGFGHLISKEMRIRPYISLGVEQLNFNTKGDLEDGSGSVYHYWPDGTIRSVSESDIGAALPISRDYVYETDLRTFEKNNYNFGNYNQRSVGIPIEMGFILNVSPRLFLSVGTELHYTFTDFIDNVAAEGTYHVGGSGNDMYMFTHASMHFDLFSDPTTRTVELLFADIELDPIFYDDEDGDMIFDLNDRCPGTPYGVVVDSVGCPFDFDSDGIPDYQDKEPESDAGVWVDDEGVTIEEDEFLASLRREDALLREDLASYMALFEETFKEMQLTEIPEKFAVLDTDEDDYISFDELLHVVDNFFDFKIKLTIEEIREVNEYFFSQ